MAGADQVRFSNPDGVAPPLGSYSHVAVVPGGCELLVVAGQVGNELGGAVSSDPAKQLERALRNIVAILESQGATPAHVVKLNTYLVRQIDPAVMRAIRADVLKGAQPPATLVYVPRLAAEQFLVEVEAWAVRPKV